MSILDGILLYLMLVGAIFAGIKLLGYSRSKRPIHESAAESDTRKPQSARTNSLIFKNIVIKSGYNTEFTEIDALIVSPYGIFCIETKKWQGYIFGDANSAKWTQCKYNNVREQRINPIRQNYGHIKCLERLLGDKLKSVDIHNIVLFAEGPKLFIDDPRVLSDIKQLENILNSHTKQIYTLQEYRTICKILAHESTFKKERLDIHIANLQANPQYS